MIVAAASPVDSRLDVSVLCYFLWCYSQHRQRNGTATPEAVHSFALVEADVF